MCCHDAIYDLRISRTGGDMFSGIRTDEDISEISGNLLRDIVFSDMTNEGLRRLHSARALLDAVIAYIYHYTTLENHTADSVMRMLEVSFGDDEDSDTPADCIFMEDEKYEPDSFAVKRYGDFVRSSSGIRRDVCLCCISQVKSFELAAARENTAKILSEMLEEHLGPRGGSNACAAKGVMFDLGKPERFCVDFMRFVPLGDSVSGIEKGDVYCYEIVPCPEDFDAAYSSGMPGDYNYCVATRDTYEALRDRLGYGIGVLCPDEGRLEVVKTAVRRDRKRPLAEILYLIARSSGRDLDRALSAAALRG